MQTTQHPQPADTVAAIAELEAQPDPPPGYSAVLLDSKGEERYRYL